MLKVDERISGVGESAAVQLSDNSRAVLERRYLRRGPEGTPIETVEEMFHRVASHVALAEEETGGNVTRVREGYANPNAVAVGSAVGVFTVSGRANLQAQSAVAVDFLRFRNTGGASTSTAIVATIGREKWEPYVVTSQTWTPIPAASETWTKLAA